MYCPSCGSEISVELKYCNRCGANLSAMPISYPPPVVKPIRLALPSIILGLTVVAGLGIITDGAKELAAMHLHPAAITWMALFSLATLFGCTALILRLWLKVFVMNRETHQPQEQPRFQARTAAQLSAPPQFQPRLEAMPSVTEHTTRTFSPAYRDRVDPEPR